MLYLLPVLLPPSDTKSINATLSDKELVKHIEDKHFSCVWLIVLVIQAAKSAYTLAAVIIRTSSDKPTGCFLPKYMFNFIHFLLFMSLFSKTHGCVTRYTNCLYTNVK